ncbi:hypothetical protein ABH994_005554 [Bradyrhizobium yuanmingense]|uniref:hypothetical protein n=1 Tax=Bradyrhizobium yuanmingense TaxID=108015 RepID=UPI003515C53F
MTSIMPIRWDPREFGHGETLKPVGTEAKQEVPAASASKLGNIVEPRVDAGGPQRNR